jgi:hypothetical protein
MQFYFALSDFKSISHGSHSSSSKSSCNMYGFALIYFNSPFISQSLVLWMVTLVTWSFTEANAGSLCVANIAVYLTTSLGETGCQVGQGSPRALAPSEEEE